MTKVQKLRIVTATLAIVIIIAGIVGELHYGALCSLEAYVISVTDSVGFLLRALGLWRIPVTLTCPLGFLERSLVSQDWLPQWPFVLIVIVSVLVLGRIFCAWVCPTVLLRRVWVDRRGKSSKPTPLQPVTWASYSSYAILAGVLVGSFLFRFPVFCFFCPIGLFFGTVYALLRVFTPDSAGLELVIFPAMLGLELWGLKSWCRSICPLGALLSLVGNFNRILLPSVQKEECLSPDGTGCGVCKRACPEGIDLTQIRKKFHPNSCTKCLECYNKCPAHAIEIPLMK